MSFKLTPSAQSARGLDSRSKVASQLTTVSCGLASLTEIEGQTLKDYTQKYKFPLKKIPPVLKT